MRMSRIPPSRHDEYTPSCAPGTILGITREHIVRGKLKDIFLPGDIILFRYREYSPSILELYKQQRLARQSKWSGCDGCRLDYVCVLSLVAVSAVTTIYSVVGSIPSFTFSEVTSRLANITLGNLCEGFFIPIILGAATLPFLAIPYLPNSSTQPHPHFIHRFHSRFFSNPNTMADFTQTLHIRSSFWKYLTKSNTSTRPRQQQQHRPQQLLPPNNHRHNHNIHAPTQQTTNPLTSPSILSPLQAGELVTVLTPYPDLFTCTYLRPLNTLYLRFREWRRWHAAAFIYAELEHLGALKLDANAKGYLPAVEFQVVRLLEDLNRGGEDGAGYVVNRRHVVGHVEVVERTAGDFGVDVTALPGVLPFRSSSE